MSSTRYAHLPLLCAQFHKYLLQGLIKPRVQSTLDILHDAQVTPNADLNEAQVRQSFVLPIIQMLGWDVEDPFEVFPEERAMGGFIDIRLRTVEGASVIWEIKRPSVSLDLATETGREAAYQGVGYSRTYTQSPFCVVTNFETTHIFHSYTLPSKESISKNLIASFTWLEARDGLADEIFELLEKHAVQAGKAKQQLDCLVKDKHVLRATRPLHESILEDLEFSRLCLAKELSAKFHPMGATQFH